MHIELRPASQPVGCERKRKKRKRGKRKRRARKVSETEGERRKREAVFFLHVSSSLSFSLYSPYP
jgi:hypothetical protein